MTKANRHNPFGLTFHECEVMSALVRLGSPKAVAAELNCNPKTARNMLRNACKKMGASTILLGAVMWVRERNEAAEFYGKRGTASVFHLGAQACQTH